MEQLKEVYSLENNLIMIIDPELGINISVPLSELYLPKTFSKDKKPADLHLVYDNRENLIEAYYIRGKLREGQYKSFYPGGKLKSELFYHQGQLHGPSSFYTEAGTLLSRSWFVYDQKQGKSKFYYPSGKLYSIQTYHQGLKEGAHEYFYENGTLKTLMFFKDDQQVKTAQLFYSNGQLKREIEFQKGQKSGKDFFWSVSGQILEETFYQGHVREKYYRKWHPNGHLALEYIYHTPSLYDETHWNVKGGITLSGKYFKEDQSYIRTIYDEQGQIVSEIKGQWDGKQLQFE